MEESKKNKKGVSGLVVFIIVIITIVISAPLGYILGNKFINNTSTKTNETNNINTTNNTENKKINYLTSADIANIKIMYPDFDYYLENIFENAGYEWISVHIANGTMNDYITNNLNGNDLLDNENFKFSFAFHVGWVLYSEKYTASEEVTGLWSISVSDFEEIYKNLYSEDYTFTSIPSGADFELEDNEIIGSIYTGYFNQFYFDLTENDNSFISKIYNYDYETNDKGNNYYGTMKLSFEKDENGLYSIKHLYLTK